MALIRLLSLLCALSVLLVDVGSVNAAAIVPDTVITDSQRVINSIAASDRGFFVTYHMTIEANAQGRRDVEVFPGFERDAIYPEFQLISVPNNFGHNLLAWAERDTPKIPKLLAIISRRNVICFPSGCLDPSDVGSNCCPF